MEHMQGRPRCGRDLALAPFNRFDLGRAIKTKRGQAQFIEREPKTQRRLKLPSCTQLYRGDLRGMVGGSQAWGRSLPLLALCPASWKYRQHINPTVLTLRKGAVNVRESFERYLPAGEQDKAPASHQMPPTLHSPSPSPNLLSCL